MAGFWSRVWDVITGGKRNQPAPPPDIPQPPQPEPPPEPPAPTPGDVPQQFAGYEASYWSNVGPFAMDTNLSETQFGHYQQLFYDGFVVAHGGHVDRGAQDAFIDALALYYGDSFDWNTWREEYDAL